MDKFLLVQNPMVEYSGTYILAMGKQPQLFKIERGPGDEKMPNELYEIVELFPRSGNSETWVITCMDWDTTTRPQDQRIIKRVIRWFRSYRQKFPDGHKVQP